MPETKQFTCSFEFKELTENGQFDGHAAVFGNVDLQGDRIKRGAFARTLEATRGRWPILMGHLMSRVVGFSLGAEEDSKGLAVTGEFTMDSDEGRNAYATARHAARVKSPLGLSIGYGIGKDGAKFNSESGVRDLTDLDVYEFSLAAVPANPRARMGRVKAEDARIKADDLLSAPQIEEVLREAGFSRHEARRLMFCMSALREVEPDATTLLGASDPEAIALVNAARSCNLLVQVKELLWKV
jgi:HK97 family phage prohead protease